MSRPIPEARHYCKYCNCWIGNNAVSIAHHENGFRHKAMVKSFMIEQDKKRREKEREERELHKTLQTVERAALAQYQQDRELFSGVSSSSGAAPPPPPPPPRKAPSFSSSGPRRPGPGAAEGSRFDAEDIARVQARLDGEDSVEEDAAQRAEPDPLDTGIPPGQYSVDGVTYLEAPRYLDKVQPGRRCEAFARRRHGEEPDWLPATIVSLKTFPVPNTSIILRRCVVRFTDGSLSAELPVDDVRFRAPPPPSQPRGLLPAFVPSTAATAEDQVAGDAFTSKDSDALAVTFEPVPSAPKAYDDDEGDDAFRAYNPYGGSYRGIQLRD